MFLNTYLKSQKSIPSFNLLVLLEPATEMKHTEAGSHWERTGGSSYYFKALSVIFAAISSTSPFARWLGKVSHEDDRAEAVSEWSLLSWESKVKRGKSQHLLFFIKRKESNKAKGISYR